MKKIIFKEEWLLNIIAYWDFYKKNPFLISYGEFFNNFRSHILKIIEYSFENWDNKFFNKTFSFVDEENGVPIKPEKIQIIDNELFVNDKKVFFKADYIEMHSLAFDNYVNLHYAIINDEPIFLLTKIKAEHDEDDENKDEDEKDTIQTTMHKRLSQEEYNAIMNILPILKI